MTGRRQAFLTAALLLIAIPSVHAVTYVESSAGLDQPGMDGGDSELEFGDVNGDGHIDLVSVGDHGNPLVNTLEEGIMVWLGNGLGGWTHRQYGYLGYGGVALGDLNGDGLMDVAYGIHHDYSSTDLGDQILEAALGDGSGTFWTAWDDGLVAHGEYWGLFATDLADLEGDGDLDIGSTGFGSSAGFQVYLNRSDGTWARSFGYLGGNSDHIFQFGDVNGDGHPDVATSKQEGTVWLGDGEGYFELADGNLPSPGGWSTRPGPSLGDVNGDGRDDLAYCDGDGNGRVWLWTGDGTWNDVSAGVGTTGDCEYTALHDMDGDGLVDLVTFGDGWVRVFTGDGSGAQWTTDAAFHVGLNPGTGSAFRVGGDVDHNGLPDIAMLAERQISIFDDENVLKVYRETTIPAALSVRLVAPGPNRRLHAGATTFVEWASGVPPGQTSTVDLELSSDGPDGPWVLVATGLPDNGRYQWIVPLRPTSDGRFRVTVHWDGQQVSAVGASFTIARRPDPLRLEFSGPDSLTWTDELSRGLYHLYRGDWQRFVDTGEYTQDPAVVPAAQRFCNLDAAVYADAFVPAPGDLAFYLVTGYRTMEDGQEPGVAVPMTEGTLGQDSGARTRSSPAACSDEITRTPR
jgi:hypothetical protein